MQALMKGQHWSMCFCRAASQHASLPVPKEKAVLEAPLEAAGGIALLRDLSWDTQKGK